MQTVCLSLVSANSESWSGVQSDPTRYDKAVKYVGVMKVNGCLRTLFIFTMKGIQ